jgi:ribonuclease III
MSNVNTGEIETESPYAFAQRVKLPIKQDFSLLQRALTHRSYINEHQDSLEDNERLEFLGDAVLDFIVGAYLYKHFPEMAEGDLTRMRSALVHTEQLARNAQVLDLGRALRLGNGEIQAGGRLKVPILCDAFEAITGAIYLANGLDAVIEFVQPFIDSQLTELQDQLGILDAKSRLQEWSQARGMLTPTYFTKAISGPEHERSFEVEVKINGETLGTGQGRSKQAAEKAAAKNALITIDKNIES